MKATITDRCKIWEITDKNGYAEVRFSTSRKLRDNDYDKGLATHEIAKNGYVSENYAFVKFVKDAYEKLKNLQEDTNIIITNLVADMNREPYWDAKNNIVTYPQNFKFTVFNFDVYNNDGGQNKNFDKAPIVEQEAKPIKQVTEQEVTSKSASDECPF